MKGGECEDTVHCFRPCALLVWPAGGPRGYRGGPRETLEAGSRVRTFGPLFLFLGNPNEYGPKSAEKGEGGQRAHPTARTKREEMADSQLRGSRRLEQLIY